MTAVPSIDMSVWVDEHLGQASPDLLRNMVKTFAGAMMSAEADAVCGAAYGTVSDDRVNYRNGYRLRDWDTRVGTVHCRSRGCGRGRICLGCRRGGWRSW